MKEINRKGFTLVEVLGVIVILTILVFLVTTAILGYFQKGKDDYNDKLEKQLVLAGKTYYANHKEELPTEISERSYGYVTLPTMQSNNYIAKNFIDSEGRECSPSFVFVHQKEDKPSEYEYIPCLICQDKNNNEVSYSDSEYCDPSNWQNNNIIDDDDDDDDPDITDETNVCKYTRSGNQITITNATMSKGISRIYYVDGSGNQQNIWTSTDGTTQTTLTNITATVSAGLKVYAVDSSNKQIECLEIPNTPSPSGSGSEPPVCSISIPGWFKDPTVITATCKGVNNTNIKVGNINNIKVDGLRGKITNRTSSQVSSSEIKFSISYKPNAGTEGGEPIRIGAGTVVNDNSEAKPNAEAKGTLKVDTKKPTIKYSASGTIGKATAKKDKKSGYKNKVTVKITCSDTGSGVQALKVKIGSGSYSTVSNPYTNTKTSRGKYKYSSNCTDKAGNSATGAKTYRVIEKSANCSKCGAAKRRCSKSSNSYYIKHLAYGDVVSSCSRGRKWSPSASQCNSHRLGMLTHRCVVVSGGYRQETGSCSVTSVCKEYTCTKGKSCWY